MKIMISAALILLCGCSKPKPNQEIVTFPTHQNLDCAPFGIRSVLFDVSEDEDDEFEVPSISESDAEQAMNEVIDNWASVWGEVRPRVEQLLSDYEYGKSLSELMEQPSNTIYVHISPSLDEDDNSRYRLDVAVDVGLEHGSHVFGVELEELVPIEATATF